MGGGGGVVGYPRDGARKGGGGERGKGCCYLVSEVRNFTEMGTWL